MSQRWTVADSAELYNVRSWSNGYFSINDGGNVTVEPSPVSASGTPIDLKALVDEIRERGIGLPLLLRFPHILQARVVELNEAFLKAMREYGYGATYKGVYPIKVNQDRYVVEHLVEAVSYTHLTLPTSDLV